MDGDTQVVEFQGRTIWQSHDRQEPIAFLDNEDMNDQKFTNFLDFLNKLRIAGILESQSEG